MAEPTPSTCDTCQGDGIDDGSFCLTCYGTGSDHPQVGVRQLMDKLMFEKLDDILDKCVDIKEKVDDIKEVVDGL
jgi:hypothetical protein